MTNVNTAATFHEAPIDRRRVLRVGAQSATVLAAGGLMGCSGLASTAGGQAGSAYPKPAVVRSPTDIPVVDQVAIRVVADSYHHAFEPPRTIDSMQVERLGFDVRPNVPPRLILGNVWGLSLHVESTAGTTSHQALLDFSYTPETLINNLHLCKVDVSRLDALALSHGHFDHFGGLVDFLKVKGKQLKPGLPFYVGGEQQFCARELNVAQDAGNFGVLDRNAIQRAGLNVVLADRPHVFAGHGFTTGVIPQQSFERILAPTRMSFGVKDNLGCDPQLLSEAKRTAQEPLPDDFEAEQAIAYMLKGRGLVIMTSCGHRGIVNSVLRAMEVAGTDKVHAILGGFHLAPYPADYQRQTFEALKALKPDFLLPMHCSGETFISMVQAGMPDSFVRSSTGTRFVFNA